MKAGWQVKTLGEVCSFENGDRGENYPSKSVQTTSGVPFINAGHLTENGIDFDSMNYIPRERFNLLGNGKIRKDDILFCLRGSLGKFSTVGDLSEGAIASSLVIVRPKKDVINSYVLAYFQSNICSEMINSFRNGTAQPNLSAASLKSFMIPVPSVAEQQRIVAILDEAFDSIATARANTEKNLQNARALFESHLQSVFTQRGEGWSDRPLGDLCELISGQHIDAKDYNFESRGIAYLTGPSDFGSVSPIVTKWTEHPKRLAVQGDILITVKGSGVGKINVLDIECVAISRQLMAIRTKAIDRDYLYAFIASKFQYFQSLSNGAAIPGISRDDVLNLICPMPSPEEMPLILNQIQVFQKETQRLEFLYQQRLAALDELKKSLLHKAFSGEL